jgi:hypothetical protein
MYILNVVHYKYFIGILQLLYTYTNICVLLGTAMSKNDPQKFCMCDIGEKLGDTRWWILSSTRERRRKRYQPRLQVVAVMRAREGKLTKYGLQDRMDDG